MSTEANIVINLEIRPNTAAIIDGSFDGETLAEAFNEAQVVIPELILDTLKRAIASKLVRSAQTSFVGKDTITHDLTGTEMDVTVTLNASL